MTISVGTRLGPYEILSPLGAGGMGEVYRAKDARVDRMVALKVLPEKFFEDSERRGRFEREAKLLASLNHPGIAVLYSFEEIPGSSLSPASQSTLHILVMELLEGETLRSALAGAKVSTKKALEWARQMAQGLAAAHEKGIVHRDLKPENVFVTKDGRIKILDFGLAKLTEAEESPNVTNLPTAARGTEPGMVMGTLGYMSPEQVKGKPADARSDIFSFGAILYEMLSGQRAFHRETAAETISAILREEPPELSVTNQSVSPELERIVRYCIEKNPEQRFHSAHDLALTLDQLNSATSSASGTQRGLPRARRWRKGVMAATAVVALAAAFYAWKRLSPPRLLHVERLTPSSRIISSARFLPDGKSIVYTAAPDGSDAAMLGELFRLSPGEPPVSLGVRDCRVLDVSASGELILVWKRETAVDGRKESTPVLARIPAAGGTAPRVVEDEGVNIWDYARWTRDGRDLIVKHNQYKGKSTQVVVFQGRPLYEVPWGFGFADFILNDKGDAIRFIEWRATGRSFVTVSLDGRVITRTPIKGLSGWSFFPFRKHLIFLSARDEHENPVQLVQLSPSGAFQNVRQNLPTDADLWDVSPAGDMLMTTGGESNVQEVRWLEPGADRERLLDVGIAFFPALNASGTQLSCTVINKGVFLLQAGQSTATSLGEGWVLDQTADGKTLLNKVPDPDGYFRLRLLPTGAGAPRDLPGKWIIRWDSFLLGGEKAFVFGRLNDDSENHPYLLNAQAASPQRLNWPADTVAVVSGPASPDGRTAFAAATIQGDPIPWSRVDLASGALTPLPPSCAGMEPEGWTASGESIWLTKPFAKDRSFPMELWRCDLKTGKAENVRKITGPDYPLAKLSGFTITPDGRSYAYVFRYGLPVRKDLFRVSGAL